MASLEEDGEDNIHVEDTNANIPAEAEDYESQSDEECSVNVSVLT